MRISAEEWAFLGAIDLHPVWELGKLARALRMRPSRVRYLVQKFTERGVLYQRARINFFMLGILDTAIFFALDNISKSARKAFESSMMRDARISWFGSLAGEYQYGAIAFTEDLAEFSRLLGVVSERAGNSLRNRAVSPRLSFTQLQRGYLGGVQVGRRRQETLAVTSDRIDADELDRRILRALAADGAASLREIARRLGEPFSTVERRVQKLKSVGILRDTFYELNVSSLGISAFRIHVGLRALPSSLEQEILEYCARDPHISFVTRSIGSWDYEIGVEAAEMSVVPRVVAHLSELTGQYLESVQTFGEVADLKWSFFP